jgi:hypothetical protein
MTQRDRLKYKTNRLKINFHNGRFEIPRIDDWRVHWREPYYLLLTIPWWGFLGLTVFNGSDKIRQR